MSPVPVWLRTNSLSALDRPVVLWDLDGTVSDSAPGILASLRQALADHGLPPLDVATERGVVGPPLYELLPGLIPATAVPDVISSYRKHYGDGGMFDTAVFPGVRQILERLEADGRRLAVATSKPEYFAVPVLEKLGLTEFFEVIGGDDLEGGRPTKGSVIAHVLEELGGPRAVDTVMVGDRKHDVIGARECGVNCIAVRWGYASSGELEDERPAAIAESPRQLADILGVGCEG